MKFLFDRIRSFFSLLVWKMKFSTFLPPFYICLLKGFPPNSRGRIRNLYRPNAIKRRPYMLWTILFIMLEEPKRETKQSSFLCSSSKSFSSLLYFNIILKDIRKSTAEEFYLWYFQDILTEEKPFFLLLRITTWKWPFLKSGWCTDWILWGLK